MFNSLQVIDQHQSICLLEGEVGEGSHHLAVAEISVVRESLPLQVPRNLRLRKDDSHVHKFTILKLIAIGWHVV